jgi:hypothetical protein
MSALPILFNKEKKFGVFATQLAVGVVFPGYRYRSGDC